MSERRIAIVYDSLYPVNRGGGERVYRRIAEELAERGNVVDYLTRIQWEPTAVPDSAFRIIPVWRGEIYTSSGARTTRSAVGFAWGVFRALRASRGRYDMVIASALPVLTLIAARIALLGTRTYLVGDWLEVWPLSKWRSYAGWLPGTAAWILQFVGAHASDLQTVNSAFTARRLRRVSRHSKPVVLGLFDLVGDGHPPVSPQYPPFALFVGRHIADKGVTSLPRAVAFARHSIPELRLVIAGSGPDTVRLETEIATNGAAEWCEIVGRVGDTQIQLLQSQAAVLVNPSVREGFGLVVVESASRGVPSVIVAGDDNAATELVINGVNGEIAASREPNDMGASIVRVVAAGLPLRTRTREWFDDCKSSHGIRDSVTEILAHYDSARSKD
jgi:glycosyltransferase involved in cell wall biosynthesis